MLGRVTEVDLDARIVEVDPPLTADEGAGRSPTTHWSWRPGPVMPTSDEMSGSSMRQV